MDECERDGVPVKKTKSLGKYLINWEEAYPYFVMSNIAQGHAFC